MVLVILSSWGPPGCNNITGRRLSVREKYTKLPHITARVTDSAETCLSGFPGFLQGPLTRWLRSLQHDRVGFHSNYLKKHLWYYVRVGSV